MNRIENSNDLFRIESGAVVNNNTQQYSDYIRIRNERKKQKDEIEKIKNDIEEIKKLLKEVLHERLWFKCRDIFY